MITIHQRYRQTDRQTTCDRNTALCTKVHRAVKMMTYWAFELTGSTSAKWGVCVGRIYDELYRTLCQLCAVKLHGKEHCSCMYCICIPCLCVYQSMSINMRCCHLSVCYWLVCIAVHQGSREQRLISWLSSCLVYIVVAILALTWHVDELPLVASLALLQIGSDIGLLRVDKRNSTIHCRNDIRNNVNE